MKVCIIQPPYSGNYADAEACFQKQLELMDQCDPSMDVIVLPESCDIPSLARTKEESEASSDRYNKTMVDAAIKLAKRCSATVFFNARSYGETGTRNTTYTINRQGEIVGKYYKEHLTPGEVSKMKLDSGYTFEPTEPIIVEVDGIRYAFLVCYDFYFYEMFPQIARYRPDVIIGCSHQRSDSHDALEIMG
ncbi:MAG: carbon-nitrogen hydrolase family protein, partial [Clostridia bacterium]|nr:carbon-nitrogen hydrolase family protein [Clostridia bacterium]